jgi:hypothetical protein
MSEYDLTANRERQQHSLAREFELHPLQPILRTTSSRKLSPNHRSKTPTTLQLSRTNATHSIPSTQSLKIRLSVTLYLHTRVAAVAACAGKAQANEIEKNPPGEALL